MPKNKRRPKRLRQDRVEADRFRRYVTANATKLHGLLVAEAVRRSGCAIAEITGRQILRAGGIRPFRPVTIGRRMNWSLPTKTLAQVWGQRKEYVAAMRWTLGAPGPKWDSRRKATYLDPAYLRAVAAERKKAEAARADVAARGTKMDGRRRAQTGEVEGGLDRPSPNLRPRPIFG